MHVAQNAPAKLEPERRPVRTSNSVLPVHTVHHMPKHTAGATSHSHAHNIKVLEQQQGEFVLQYSHVMAKFRAQFEPELSDVADAGKLHVSDGRGDAHLDEGCTRRLLGLGTTSILLGFREVSTPTLQLLPASLDTPGVPGPPRALLHEVTPGLLVHGSRHGRQEALPLRPCPTPGLPHREEQDGDGHKTQTGESAHPGPEVCEAVLRLFHTCRKERKTRSAARGVMSLC
eukprot:482574-Rhodomonas_salina.1